MDVETVITVLSLLEHMAAHGTFTTSEFTHVGKITQTLRNVVGGKGDSLKENVVRDVIRLLEVSAKRGAFTVDKFVLVGSTYDKLQNVVTPASSSR